ncbi:hypothetical protein C8R47DRAFT_307811 [Mycena vitilis]|nr:hypothetical protein C8R47DRAFT_307811 [Mycena vitilis]
MAAGTASQLTQILWVFAAILMSHLQDRLRRRPEGECPLRPYTSRSWDTVSLSCDASNRDPESQPSNQLCSQCSTIPITIRLHFGNPEQPLVEDATRK